MRGSVAQCPEPEVLAALCRGELDGSARRSVESHFDVCASCARVAADLVRIYATDGSSGEAAPADSARPQPVASDGPAPSSSGDAAEGDDAEAPIGGPDSTLVDRDVAPRIPRTLPPGARLDRYHVLEVVGRGGMGTVYAAYDPDLDRKVALKLLHQGERDDDDRAQRRLLREAQALARLSHPNVITVHEARVVDGRVFLSMEFVDGGTLGQWLAQRKPELPELLEMFRGIGRGLAAAHAAGLVHRDVKPDNVLIGGDRRPRVTDFGLARPSEEGAPAIDGDLDSASSGRPSSRERRRLDATITRAGALVGTPAYMSPEQLRRQPATAASDQFSFCVVLFEALWGARPFAGKGLLELATNVVSGTIVEPARDPAVPRWLRQVVLRGLAVDSAARWPSMDALVDQLQPPRWRGRHGLWLAGGAALATASGFALAGKVAPDPCAAADGATETVWNAKARATVFGALADGTSSYAEDTATLVVDRLDSYAAQLAAGQREACSAYHHGGQSHEALDLRRSCLDERLGDLGALVDVLDGADDDVRRNAVTAVDGLAPVATCADLEALRVRLPLPDDPSARARFAELDQARAVVLTEVRAGRYREGMRDADALVEQGRALGHDALLARILRARAELERRLGRREDAIADLREAWTLALGAGDELTAAACIVALVADLGAAAAFEEAAFRTHEARAMVDRVRRHDPVQAETLEALLDEALGRIALRQHRYEDAVAFYERAIAVTERQSGADSLSTGQAVNALAAAKLAEKRWDEAVSLFRRVLEIRIKHLGHSHPESAQARNSLGLALKNAGRLEEAEDELGHALELLVEALGSDDRSVRMIETNLAEVYYSQDRHVESAMIWDGVLGLDGVARADDEFGIRRAMHYATSLVYVGRVAEGRAVMELCHQRLAVLSAATQMGLMFELDRLDGFVLGGRLGP